MIRRGEALSIYLHDLRQLIDRGMPKLDSVLKEQFILHQFVAGLPATVSRQLRAAGGMTNLQTHQRILAQHSTHKNKTRGEVPPAPPPLLRTTLCFTLPSLPPPSTVLTIPGCLPPLQPPPLSSHLTPSYFPHMSSHSSHLTLYVSPSSTGHN